MSAPDPLKSYRLYVAMFLLNLAVVIGVIYLLRRPEPREVLVTRQPMPPAPETAKITPSPIRVAISGAVMNPGTLQLPGTARLADALQMAGVMPAADLSALNLTSPLRDGDNIRVPERAPGPPPVNNLGASGVPAPAKININTASLAELDTLPGIGPALAQRILDYRSARGGFSTIQEIKDVNGIGDALFQDIKDKITVQ
jgi:competence protein ComEA